MSAPSRRFRSAATSSSRRTFTPSVPSGRSLCRRKLSLMNTTQCSRGSADHDNSISVAVRVRPFTNKELQECPSAESVVQMSPTQVIVQGNQFHLDHCFWSCDNSSRSHEDVGFADQSAVYNALAAPLLTRALEGYNVCLFAYGPTGTGKSHTITGTTEQPGVVPRFIEELFLRRDTLQAADQLQVRVELSFFEIYNEKIHDLLSSSHDKSLQRSTLKVREHPQNGPYVEGLSSFVVPTPEAVYDWLSLGNKQRATASTAMNDKSSRSHSICTVRVTQTRREDGDDDRVVSSVNLVDLAGSERQNKAMTSATRLREASNINRSLLTLGKVISLLSEAGADQENRNVTSGTPSTKRKRVFIPYRDSVLTWLLRESLGGNSHTAIVATVSPAASQLEETLNTVRYASQARSIVNCARVNEDPQSRQLREMRQEMERLREELAAADPSELEKQRRELESLRRELMEREMRERDVERSLQKKLEESESRRKEEVARLEKHGIAMRSGLAEQPSLVNLNSDPQLSETVIYPLHEGDTVLSRSENGEQNSEQVIPLTGSLVRERHCRLRCAAGHVRVKCLNGETFVNGRLLNDGEDVLMKHGDRLVLAGEHFFRLHNPKCRVHVSRVEFTEARDELHKVQEAHVESQVRQAVDRAVEQAREEAAAEQKKLQKKLEDLQTELTQTRQKIVSCPPSDGFSSSCLAVAPLVEELNSLITPHWQHLLRFELDTECHLSELGVRVVSQQLGAQQTWTSERAADRLVELRRIVENSKNIEEKLHEFLLEDNGPMDESCWEASFSVVADVSHRVDDVPLCAVISTVREGFTNIMEDFETAGSLGVVLTCLEQVYECANELENCEDGLCWEIALKLQTGLCRLLLMMKSWLHGYEKDTVDLEILVHRLCQHGQQILRAVEVGIGGLRREASRQLCGVAVNSARLLGACGECGTSDVQVKESTNEIYLVYRTAAVKECYLCVQRSGESIQRAAHDLQEVQQCSDAGDVLMELSRVGGSLLEHIGGLLLSLQPTKGVDDLSAANTRAQAAQKLNKTLLSLPQLLSSVLRLKRGEVVPGGAAESLRQTNEMILHCDDIVCDSLCVLDLGDLHDTRSLLSSLQQPLGQLTREIVRLGLPINMYAGVHRKLPPPSFTPRKNTSSQWP